MWLLRSALDASSPTYGFLPELFEKKQEHESHRRHRHCNVCVDKYIFDVKNVKKPRWEKQHCVENSAKKALFKITIFTFEPGMCCFHPVLFFYCGSLLCLRVMARYGEGFKCLKWTIGERQVLASSECLPSQNGGRSPWLLFASCPKQLEAAPALREGSHSAHCKGHCSQEPPCPRAGRHPPAWLLSLTYHPHARTQWGRKKPLLFLVTPWSRPFLR